MALSWSGETAELKNLIDYSRRFRIGLIAVTAEAESTLGKAADVALVLPQAREACPHNLAPTTSSLMQLALGDALAIALLESRGFTAVDFGMLHPGGRLGALLKFVRDVMHERRRRCRWCALGTKMSDAVLEMSAKGFGCIGITDGDGKLVGIITDGDLRRHMRGDLLDATRRRDHDPQPEDRPARSTRQRGARTAQLHEDHRAVRGRSRAAGRHRAYPRSVAGRRRLALDAEAPLRLLYVVTEDWYFLSHRLPMARAARDAGFEVHVATRVADGAAAIGAEGFTLHPVPFVRGRLSPSGTLATIRALRRHPPRRSRPRSPITSRCRRRCSDRSRHWGAPCVCVNALTGSRLHLHIGQRQGAAAAPVAERPAPPAARPIRGRSCWSRTPTTAPACSRSASPPNGSC